MGAVLGERLLMVPSDPSHPGDGEERDVVLTGQPGGGFERTWHQCSVLLVGADSSCLPCAATWGPEHPTVKMQTPRRAHVIFV